MGRDAATSEGTLSCVSLHCSEVAYGPLGEVVGLGPSVDNPIEGAGLELRECHVAENSLQSCLSTGPGLETFLQAM